MEISIIGFGNFGKFMAKHLSKKAEVFVTDTENKEKEAEEIGVSFVSLQEALKNKIIILAVPMENIVSLLHEIKDSLQPGTLILDICSLKLFSCNAMEEILPRSIEIIGTHPLFGPNSAPNSVEGMKIAITPVRTSRLDKVKSFCESLGLKVFITTPEEHDKQMALSQALTHLIGQAMNNAGIKRVELSTKTFDKLMDVVEIIRNDTPALFKNMQQMNPFAKDAREKFVIELNKINENFFRRNHDRSSCF